MPKGRFWMGKCESCETSTNDLSDMGRDAAPRRPNSAARSAYPTANSERANLRAAHRSCNCQMTPRIAGDIAAVWYRSAIRATQKNRQTTKTNPHFRLPASSRFDSYPIDARQRAPPRPTHSGNRASLFGLLLGIVAADGEDRL